MILFSKVDKMRRVGSLPSNFITGKMGAFAQLITLFMLQLIAHAAVIVPGATWTDTSGNVIQAHGGGFLKVCQTL